MEDEKIIQNSVSGQEGYSDKTPLSNEKFEPINDGNIPQNSEGITSGEYEALENVGSSDLSFEEGNFNLLKEWPELLNSKIALLNQTFIPLVEVSLIELLGSSSLYQRKFGQCAVAFNNNQASISFSFIYSVSNWIGIDIDLPAIQHDSNYVLNKIRPVGANITKVEIDTTEGTLTIAGTI